MIYLNALYRSVSALYRALYRHYLEVLSFWIFGVMDCFVRVVCVESVHDILNGGTSVGTSVGTTGYSTGGTTGSSTRCPG